MAGTIKGMTIEIGGNTEPLEQALKSTNKEINATQKELKEVNKLLKLDPTNTQLLAQKQQLLGDQIKQTTTKLDALKQAQKQFEEEAKKGGEINQAEYRKIQREIMSAEKSLKDLKEEAKNTNPQMQKLQEELKKAGDVAQKGLKAGLDVVKTGLVALSGACVSAVTSLGALAIKSGALADDLNTLSATTGLSTEQLQKFQYASDLIDVDMNTLSGALKKTTSAMNSAKDGTGKSAEAFKKLGVQIKNADGTLRNNNDVFEDSIRALGNIANETERDALAMELFGKSATELNPLIEGGIDALDEMGKRAEELGLILSQDTLDGANAFNDELDILKANGKGIFNKIGMEVAKDLVPAMQKLNEATEGVIKRLSTSIDEGGVTGLITELGNIFNEIDWGEVAQNISDGLNLVLETMNDFLSNIDWQGFGEGIIEFIKNIDWQGLIAGVFQLIGGIIGAGIGLLSGAFNTLKNDISNWWNDKMEEAGGDSGQAFLNGAKEVIQTSGSTLYDSLAQPLAQGLADALDIDVDIPNFHKLTQNIGIWWEDLKYKWQNNILLPIETALYDLDFKIRTFFDGIGTKWNNFWTWLGEIWNGFLSWCLEVEGNVKGFVDGIFNNVVTFFTDLGTKLQEFITITVPEKWNELWEYLKGLPKKLTEVGKNLVEGLWNGMKDAKDWLIGKIKSLCDDALRCNQELLWN